MAYEDFESVWIDEVDDFVTKSSIWIIDSDGKNQKKIVDFGLSLPEPTPSYSPLAPPSTTAPTTTAPPTVPPTEPPIHPNSFKIPGFCYQCGLGWSLDGSNIIYREGMYNFYIVGIGKEALLPSTTSPTQTVTPTSKTILTRDEDPFNYKGEYELDEAKLSDDEIAVLPYVMNYASEYKISPCLIMAVIRQESNFKADANGGADVGYMQVTYDAAQDSGYKDTEQEWQETDGLDPELNIHYGTKYLMALNYIFNEGKLLTGDLKATKVPDTEERLKFVLAAYNGGAGRIAKAQQLCEEAGDDPEKWDDVKNYLEAAGATSEKAEIIKKYVDQVIEGRDLINGQRRGYEFFLTIRVPVGGASMPEEGVPGFEVVFAIAGFLTIAYLLKKRKLTR